MALWESSLLMEAPRQRDGGRTPTLGDVAQNDLASGTDIRTLSRIRTHCSERETEHDLDQFVSVVSAHSRRGIVQDETRNAFALDKAHCFASQNEKARWGLR